MAKRKRSDGKDGGVEPLPIPIQSFLWRQSSPFIRQKLSKQCEASCVSFERVIVQNILHGLSPSLCEAIQGTSRWRMVQASLSHVIHCCAHVLTNRKQTRDADGNLAKFTPNEVKLLYTLHWIMLDAASECEDLELEQLQMTGGGQSSTNSFLHSLDSIHLFVYMLIPLLSSLHLSDFQSLKLENGRRLWEALWNHRQPEVPCFSTPVKAKRVLLKAQRHAAKVNFNMANIYVGHGTSASNVYLGFDEPDETAEGAKVEREATAAGEGGDAESSEGAEGGSPRAPLARMSDICALSTTETTMSFASADQFCIVCSEPKSSCVCGGSLPCPVAASNEEVERRPSTMSDNTSLLGAAVDKTFVAQRLENAISTFVRSYPNTDGSSCLSATYLDVAVLKCLLSPQWHVDGVCWSLRYLHHRLLEISSELQAVDCQRERSHSLPTPDVPPLTTDAPPSTPPPPSPTSSRKDSVAIERQSAAEVSLTGQGSIHSRHERAYNESEILQTQHIEAGAGKTNDMHMHGRHKMVQHYGRRDEFHEMKLQRDRAGIVTGDAEDGEPQRSEPVAAFKRIKVFSDHFKSLRGGGSSGVIKSPRASSSTKSSPERDSSAEREYLLGPDSSVPSVRYRRGAVGKQTLAGVRGSGNVGCESDEDTQDSMDERGGGDDGEDDASNLLLDNARRKSMPVFLQQQYDSKKLESNVDAVVLSGGEALTSSDECRSTGDREEQTAKDSFSRTLSLKPQVVYKPIITITSDSPDPGGAVAINMASWGGGGGVAGVGAVGRRRDSMMSVKSGKQRVSVPVNSVGVYGDRGDGADIMIGCSVRRSFTDSSINYKSSDEIEEVPGSIFYIQPNGQINYHVILKAVHNVSGQHRGADVSSTIFNIINCFIDLGVVETAVKSDDKAGAGGRRGSARRRSAEVDGDSQGEGEAGKTREKEVWRVHGGSGKESESPGVKAYITAIDTVFRVYKTLGCQHGCGEGAVRSAEGDRLRQQGSNCLTRLMNINPRQFKKFVRTTFLSQPLQALIDSLHALLGFCAEPSMTGPNTGVKKMSLSENVSSLNVTSPGSQGHRTGYASNFGEPSEAALGSNVLGQIVVQILKPMMSKFVENKRELFAHENIGLYCETRQLLTYIKEAHGSTFRRVALSGILDALRPGKTIAALVDTALQSTSRPMRTLSMTSESGDERESRILSSDVGTGKTKGRKSLFRRKIKQHIMWPLGHGGGGGGGGGTLSDSDILDEPCSGSSYHGRLSPRVSVCVTADNDDSISYTQQPRSVSKRKASKFNIAWRRATKSNHDDDSLIDQMSSLRPLGRIDTHYHDQSAMSGGAISDGGSPSNISTPTRQKPMSFKAASQATMTFLSARRRIEDSLKSFNKKKPAKRESLGENAQHGNGYDKDGAGSSAGTGSSKETALLVREIRLVNSYAVKSGLLRFNFMLDCCNPGSLPDAHLIAALLDLEAPIVSRAALLLECAHFVSRCNRGDWPNWMKLNLPGFCPTGHGRGQPTGYRRNLMLQRAAGKLFHQWAEALGNHMSDIMADEAMDVCSLVEPVKDDSRKRELRAGDDEEDFLDEAKVNKTGSDCPYALKLVACQLMLEVTTFLRETYQYLPKVKLIPRESTCGERTGGVQSAGTVGLGGLGGGGGDVGARRWSSVLGSPGASERSNSRSSQDDGSGNPSTPGAAAATTGSERKISFAVLGQSGDHSDSQHSSTASLSQPDIGIDSKGRRVTMAGSVSMVGGGGGGGGGSMTAGGASGQKLLKARRGSAHNISFKLNHSFKMKRPDSGGSIKRPGSPKGRKVSSQSLQSTASVEDTASSFPTLRRDSTAAAVTASSAAAFDLGAAASGSPAADSAGTAGDTWGIYVGDEVPDAADPVDATDDQDCARSMPWIKVVIQLANASNFICDHQSFCHINCYERQRRSCSRLVAALRHVYNSSKAQQQKHDEAVAAAAAAAAASGRAKAGKDMGGGVGVGGSSGGGSTAKDRLKRRTSSPMNRRESTPLLEKVKMDTSLINKLRNAVQSEKDAEAKKKSKEKKEVEDLPVLKYLNSQVLSLTHAPLALVTKAAPILPEDAYLNMMPVAWELLIESDQELAAAAAVLFILASVMVPEQIKDLMSRQLNHDDVAHRISAVQRFSVLWRFRYQVWPRMEDGAHVYFKIPPPSIDFVLPSPTIGLPSCPIIDPPWMPHFKTKVEEVTINQKESKSLVTATTTRRKQQQQMIHRALLAEEDRRRGARENFHMTSIAVNQHAAFEPALLHATEDHDDALPEEVSLAVASRRMSVAPVNRAAAAAVAAAASNVRIMSGRHSSMFYGRSTTIDGAGVGEDDKSNHFHSSHHLQVAQQFFPSCICNAALPIIHLLDDLDVSVDGISVSEVAGKVIWDCLVEEPTLFLRTFLEKLTHRNRQQELIFLLRKLLYHLPNLPAQTAHCLFNYLIGFIMFYVRSPTEGGQEAVAEALSVIWLVVPSVNGIYFKDLKQTLRKEQCDPNVMIAANVPSAKKLIVHGPDLSCIPSQFPIHEDTQFFNILHESLDFFNIPPEEHGCHFLVDTKTNQMHNMNSYVRDFYFFRRNFYPQLSLVKMDPTEAHAALHKQAFTRKFVELEKVLFSLAVVNGGSGQQVHSHVLFLHEELLKLPSFPRKALESDFALHHGLLGEEIAGLDLLHKYVWAKLISEIFRGMSSTVTHVGDLPLFLNVINGALYLHADDSAMLRLCLATFINASRHFKQVFATTGFSFIMPTILRIVYNNQANPGVCNTVHFACRQLFLLHRNPFLLQMFGSIAPMLPRLSQGEVFNEENRKVNPEALFRLLLSLEKNSVDSLDIMGLVDGPQPLTALDFCYHEDPDTVSINDVINLCVTVIAYACESVRANQMMMILESILPHYLMYLRERSHTASTSHDSRIIAAKEEMAAILNLSISIKAMLASCEPMAKNFTGGSQWPVDTATAVTTASANNNGSNKQQHQQNHSNHSPQANIISNDEQSDIKFRHMEEGLTTTGHTDMADESDLVLQDFRQPRDSIIWITAEYFARCSTRLKELRCIVGDSSGLGQGSVGGAGGGGGGGGSGGGSKHELLDHKSHNRLADIAHTLLKIAPYDPTTMKSVGLRRYILEILPITDWSLTALRPALNLILRRLERLFSKIYKSSVLRRHLDWNSATDLINGIRETLVNSCFIAHLPYLKALIASCLNIITADDSGTSSTSSSVHSIAYGRPDTLSIKPYAPALFIAAVIKLTALQMQVLGDQYTLEQACMSLNTFPSAEKTANILLNFILPLCIRTGNGRPRREHPRMRPADISFALTLVLQTLLPPVKQQTASTGSDGGSGGGGTRQHHLSVSDVGRMGSIMSHHGRRNVGGSSSGTRDCLLNIAFLGLKILMMSFESQLANHWSRISKCISELINRLQGGLPLWKFIDFVATVRTPLFMMLKPFIQFKMMKLMCETEMEFFLQQTVHQKLKGFNMPDSKSRGVVLLELVAELKQAVDDINISAFERPTANISSPVHSNRSYHRSSQDLATGSLHRSSSIYELLEQQVKMAASRKHAGGAVVSRQPGGAVGVASNAEGGTSRPSSISESPTLSRRQSRRIYATDGTLILEKYMQKTKSLEDDSVAVDVVKSRNKHKLMRHIEITSAHSRRRRQWLNLLNQPKQQQKPNQQQPQKPAPPLSHRRKSQKQAQQRDLESQDQQQQQKTDLQLQQQQQQKLLNEQERHLWQRRDKFRVISSFPTVYESVEEEDDEISVKRNCGGVFVPFNRKSSSGDEPISPPSTAGGAGAPPQEFDPGLHRLQRQDAKSRKTFKIKRNRSTIKGTVMTRSATVKSSASWVPRGLHLDRGGADFVPLEDPFEMTDSAMEPLFEEFHGTEEFGHEVGSRDYAEGIDSEGKGTCLLGEETEDMIREEKGWLGRIWKYPEQWGSRKKGKIRAAGDDARPKARAGVVGEIATEGINRELVALRIVAEDGKESCVVAVEVEDDKGQDDDGSNVCKTTDSRTRQFERFSSELPSRPPAGTAQSRRLTRFMQKSRSHDDSSEAYAPPAVGTARARIARQGARQVQSGGGGTRSPSSSPTRSATIHPLVDVTISPLYPNPSITDDVKSGFQQLPESISSSQESALSGRLTRHSDDEVDSTVVVDCAQSLSVKEVICPQRRLVKASASVEDETTSRVELLDVETDIIDDNLPEDDKLPVVYADLKDTRV